MMRAKTVLVGAAFPILGVLVAVAASAEPRVAPAADLVPGVRAHYLRPRTTPVPEAPPAGAHLTYYGGRVLSNVKVYAVNWGPSVNTTVSSQIGAFYKTITNSPYFDWLAEYDTVGLTGQDGQPGSNQRIGRGSFGGSYTLSGVTTTGTITDTQIQSALASNIASGALPQPDVDAQGNVAAIYMFDFPPNLSIVGPGGQDQSCIQFCAYHGTATIGGKNVPYGVHPDLGGGCAQGCGKDPVMFNNATSVHSHELVEAITDADVGVGGSTVGRPLAWYDDASNAGEIGDICNAMQAQLAGYTVQTEWSNAVGGCIASRQLALCNGTGNVCTPCTAQDEGAGCSGATPKCATSAGDPRKGQCVACTSNAQCSGATPTCDASGGTAQDTCRACTAKADCGGGTPACATTGAKLGQCVACTTSADCATGATCDTATNTCVDCKTSADCKNPKPVCSAARACQACATDGDCAANGSGPHCDTSSGACVARPASVSPAPGSSGAGSTATQPGEYYRAPNTNMTCATSEGAGSGGASVLGAVVGVVFAAGASLRRARRR